MVTFADVTTLVYISQKWMKNWKCAFLKMYVYFPSHSVLYYRRTALIFFFYPLKIQHGHSFYSGTTLLGKYLKINILCVTNISAPIPKRKSKHSWPRNDSHNDMCKCHVAIFPFVWNFCDIQTSRPTHVLK